MCVYFTLLLIFLNWNGDRTYSLYKEGYSVVHTLFIVVYYTKQHFGEINKYSTTFKVRHFFVRTNLSLHDIYVTLCGM